MDELFLWPQGWAMPCLSTWSLCGFRWLCQPLTVPSVLRAPSSLRLPSEHGQGSVWAEQSLPAPLLATCLSLRGTHITNAWSVNSSAQWKGNCTTRG